MKGKKKKIEYDLISDTREQNPLPFRGAIKKKLEFADYGAEVNGELLSVVFDRKNPQDLWATITHDHERFKREMERCFEAGFKLIVIVECSYSKFIEKKFEGAYNIKMPHGIIEKILHKMLVRYPGLEFVFCVDRTEMMAYIRNYFRALAEETVEAQGL